jgi:hypothetical protein
MQIYSIRQAGSHIFSYTPFDTVMGSQPDQALGVHIYFLIHQLTQLNIRNFLGVSKPLYIKRDREEIYQSKASKQSNSPLLLSLSL